MTLFYLPFLLQGLGLLIDEFYFHHQRGLGRWESQGHPLDTLTVLICYLWILIALPNALNLNIFIGLSIFSCLFVTKDEFIHARESSGGENWLHAILFILHPLTFMVAGYLWLQNILHDFLILQTLIVGLFMIYQLLYWNIKWKKTTKSIQ